MQVIPLDAVPNQSFNITLDGQNCTIHLYQRGEYMFMDLSIDDEVIRQGMICLVNISLLNFPSVDFTGYLFFADQEGAGGVPYYEELGSRYVLYFMTEDEADV